MGYHQTAGYVKTFKINAPTQNVIVKILHNIAHNEGASNIAVNKY